MIGQTISNYEIKSILGEGGMANVYLAEDLEWKVKVAIKFLKDEFVANKNIRKRFLAEARILHQLSHVNIIKVTRFIDAGDIVAFVMPYIEGESLSEFIVKKGKLSDIDIEYIFPQMLSALEYIHDKGLIHRDIKPSNFMVTKDGTIKLLDFGIAKNTNDGPLDYTQTTAAHMMGTPLYMSPEQVRNTSEVTKQTDIYSLGVVLWQMVMNKKPYNAEKLSLVEIQIKIFQEPLPLTKTIWDPFIQKATHKKLEGRYLNAKFFLKSFSNFLLQKRKKQKIDDTVFDTQPTFGYTEASEIKRDLNNLFDFILGIFLYSILVILMNHFYDASIRFFPDLFIFLFLYYLFFEYFTGRTLAQYITNTKVITLGYKDISLKTEKPTFKSILNRSFWKLMPFDSFPFLSKYFKKGTNNSISEIIVINYKSSTLKKQIREKIISYVLFIGVIITWLTLSFFSQYIFDTDHDGIKDKYDLCPEEFGGFNGCPDNDKDGVNNSEDVCPNEFGNINGCPDNDKDGVVNSEDLCPDEYGAYNGCAFKKKLILKNETDFEIKYAITYFDVDKDDFISIGHYSILPLSNFEYPFPENFSQDYAWIRGYYVNEKGNELFYAGEQSDDNVFYYDENNGFEKNNASCKDENKVNYMKIELNGQKTELPLGK
jgi:serine/threonine protein kinase